MLKQRFPTKLLLTLEAGRKAHRDIVSLYLDHTNHTDGTGSTRITVDQGKSEINRDKIMNNWL